MKDKELEDAWACGLITSCSVFRKAVNVTDQIPLVSALTGETFLLDFDHVLNYHFSDPFNDVAFVQLRRNQIASAQKFQFDFLPMKLSLHHDIYDKSVDAIVNGKDVLIAKQLSGFFKEVTLENIASDKTPHNSAAAKKFSETRDEQKKWEKTTLSLDDANVSGAAPAVNLSGELVGISNRKFPDRELLLPSKMLSAAIAADTQNNRNPEIHRPEWMDFEIRYMDLYSLGLLADPLAHDNADMLEMAGWPSYEAWYKRNTPAHRLVFVLTDKYMYLRPEEEFLGGGAGGGGGGGGREEGEVTSNKEAH